MMMLIGITVVQARSGTFERRIEGDKAIRERCKDETNWKLAVQGREPRRRNDGLGMHE
jgi:hypothetical protein